MSHRCLIKDMLQLIEAARILVTRVIQPEWNTRWVFVLTHFLDANRRPLRSKMHYFFGRTASAVP
jgi:hypothetical protein